MEIQTIEIDKINPAKYNPRKDLQPNDPEYKKLKKSILEFNMVEPLIWNQQTGNLVGGHQRLKILQEMGIKEIEVSVVDLNDTREKALNIALNKIQGEWDFPRLKDLLEELDIDGLDTEITGFDLKEIEDLSVHIFHNTDTNDSQPGVVPSIYPDVDIQDKINSAEKIIFQFSGGKDSSLAIATTIPYLPKDKIEAVYVETGAEFPDLRLHVVEFCRLYDVPLRILRPKQDFFSVFHGEFPDAIYRTCLSKLIVNPITEYAKSYDNAICIRGGRKNQKTSGASPSAKFRNVAIIDDIYCWSPLHDMSDTEFNEQIKNILLWPGYADGMIRTACWCCPFQKPEQWDAMKQRYGGLWDAMRRMVSEWKYIIHKSHNRAVDDYSQRLYKYWGQSIKSPVIKNRDVSID